MCEDFKYFQGFLASKFETLI